MKEIIELSKTHLANKALYGDRDDFHYLTPEDIDQLRKATEPNMFQGFDYATQDKLFFLAMKINYGAVRVTSETADFIKLLGVKMRRVEEKREALKATREALDGKRTPAHESV